MKTKVSRKPWRYSGNISKSSGGEAAPFIEKLKKAGWVKSAGASAVIRDASVGSEIPVALGSVASTTRLHDLYPDVVVVATGSIPIKPPIAGGEKLHVGIGSETVSFRGMHFLPSIWPLNLR